jgi:hypothetical protein
VPISVCVLLFTIKLLIQIATAQISMTTPQAAKHTQGVQIKQAHLRVRHMFDNPT